MPTLMETMTIGCNGRGRSGFSDANRVQVTNKLHDGRAIVSIELPVNRRSTCKPHCNGRGVTHARPTMHSIHLINSMHDWLHFIPVRMASLNIYTFRRRLLTIRHNWHTQHEYTQTHIHAGVHLGQGAFASSCQNLAPPPGPA